MLSVKKPFYNEIVGVILQGRVWHQAMTSRCPKTEKNNAIVAKISSCNKKKQPVSRSSDRAIAKQELKESSITNI